MPYLAIGAAVLAVLVWAGRRTTSLNRELRIASALFAALAAAGAVVAGLRGAWLASLVLVGLSAWLGETARRRGASRSVASGAGTMTAQQARAILGVGPEAGRAEIVEAYRRLIRRTHPDAGGSSGLAAQLNAARDRLLK